MRKESPSTLKIELRKHYIALRKAILPHRREIASASIFKTMQKPGCILSFYSIGSEIDLSPLNGQLAKERRLLLNRVEQGILTPYFVTDLSHLRLSSLKIPEPDPLSCAKASFSEIDWILVPGLAFDLEGYRLGYGQGHYDQLLSRTGPIPTIGVGFLEQLSKEPLPRDPWDLPVKELLLR